MIFTYHWEALTPAGRIRQGMRQAPTARAVAQQLRAEGLQASQIALSWPETLRAWLRRGPRQADVAASLAYVSNILKFTNDLRRACASARATSHNPKIRALWTAVEQGLGRGLGFSEALRAAPGVPSTVVSAVAAAERTAHLQEALAEAAGHLNEEAQIVRTLRRALTYPVILLVMTLTVGLGIAGFVLPQIAAAIGGIGDLPWLTRGMLAVMGKLDVLAIVGVLGLTAGGAGLGLWAHRDPAAFRRAVWRLPVAGSLVRDAALARFLGHLALLLSQGIQLLAAVKGEHQQIADPAMADLVDHVRVGLLRGHGPAEVLAPPAFPALVHEAARQGEETGQLPHYLGQVATLLRQQLLDRTTRLGQVIEPILLIGIAGLVVLIALALLLPIYGSLQTMSPYR